MNAVTGMGSTAAGGRFGCVRMSLVSCDVQENVLRDLGKKTVYPGKFILQIRRPEFGGRTVKLPGLSWWILLFPNSICWTWIDLRPTTIAGGRHIILDCTALS
jgi:hypothetical protein